MENLSFPEVIMAVIIAVQNIYLAIKKLFGKKDKA